ncbi:interferon-stimulated 20 kDa exonuclease-like 2 [Varanus komodoensis]|uniref:Interferon stimulated exonuclease gene 20 like 2 n=1 Tax=Varanus komodoensis TaxID=61221 RepID=A0A8D2KR55_VARKO|nr:interferon-stimulated 20 kDa exonuclease-like 2 [Varanus komodoensis]
MSDLMINIETTIVRPCAKKVPEGKKKHERFVRRRHFLERKGFLRQKQSPGQLPLPKRDASCGRPGTEEDRKRQKVDKHVRPSGRPLPRDGSAQRPKALPKENFGHGNIRGSRPQAPPPAGIPSSASGRSGSGSAEHSGAQANCGGVRRPDPRASLLSECESALPTAPAAGKPSKMVAIDCEMVGTGPGGRNSDLARCSVVGYHGDVIYDKYIRPLSPITNYRTRWSGIKSHHMKNALPFKAAQKEILKLLSGKIVVGHAIHNDFKALKYFHPKSLTRDTSKIPLLNRKAGFPENESASLKRLTKQLLHRDIQVGPNGHSSVEDARATMELYKVIEAEWERHLAASPAQD